MKTKILIVDDDLDSWRLLSTILQTHDYHPVWAADGMQAIVQPVSINPAPSS